MQTKATSRFLLPVMDILALTLSGLVGIFVRFEGAPPTALYSDWLRAMVFVVPFFALVYYCGGLYRRMWRYASVQDLVSISGTVTVAMVALVLGMRLLWPGGFPRSVLFAAWLMNIALVGGFRFVGRLAVDITKRASEANGLPTLVLGAGDAARILIEETKRHPGLGKIIGFLDDDSMKQGLLIGGLPVLGPISSFEKTVQERGIKQVVIAMPSAPKSLVKNLVQASARLGIKAQIMPGLYEVLGRGAHTSVVREVRIEDLLGRQEVKSDCQAVSGYVCGKRVLVTGAGGSIGSELCRQLARFEPAELLLLGRGENSIYDIHRELKQSNPELKTIAIIADVQDAARIQAIFATHSPEVVFHAAAHKHVPLMEENPTEAVKNNLFGTRNVAEAALAHQCKRFVLVSTDKAVNPSSVMGATKRMAELFVQSLNGTGQTKFMAVRFGNVLGSRGSVIPLFREQITQGGPITVTHPAVTRYFMTIAEAVSLIIEAGAMGQGGEVFVLDMGEPVKIVDLANDLITLSGLKPDVDISIVFSGLRPGEKMFEELWTPEETTVATRHERIRIATQRVLGGQQWQGALVRAEQMCKRCSRSEVLALLYSLEELAIEQAASALAVND